MKKNRRFKKINFTVPLQDLKKEFFKRFVSVFVICLFIVISLLLVKAFLYRSDYFRLRSVEAKDIVTGQAYNYATNGELLRLHHGKNIFAIDIKTIAKYLKGLYPDAKDIVVRRALPDKLVIDFNFRRPAVLLYDTRYYAVDEESCILTNADVEKLKMLPVITGIDIRGEEKRERRIESQNLKKSIELLREMKKSRFPVDNVLTIDAGDVNSLSIHLKNGVEIKIGCENFKERLARLKKMLKDPRLAVDKIKYIDLRFKDVIIGPK